MVAPKRLPSPHAAMTLSPRWATLITRSSKPAATRRSICQEINGLPLTPSSGFGIASDSGRMRSPRPAARIIAFTAGGFRSEGVADARLPLLQLVEQLKERTEGAVAVAAGAQIGHHAGHVIQIGALAIAICEPREDAEDLELALHAHPFEIAPEVAKVGGNGQTRVARAFP